MDFDRYRIWLEIYEKRKTKNTEHDYQGIRCPRLDKMLKMADKIKDFNDPAPESNKGLLTSLGYNTSNFFYIISTK
jgi:hypothetical protein